jgi:hypothetical protein
MLNRRMRAMFPSLFSLALLCAACVAAEPAAISQGDLARQATLSATPRTPSAAERICGLGAQDLADAYGDRATLVAAFSVTAPLMAAWQERWPEPGPSGPHVAAGTSAYRTHPADEVLSVCWFDGAFVHFGLGAGPAGLTGTPSTPQPLPVYERMVAIVDPTGHATLLAIGPRPGLAVSDPTAP